MELTQKQANVLAFIATTINSGNAPPTRSEIAMHFNWRSPNAAQEALVSLERKGAITLIPGRTRGIVITAQPNKSCPHYGGAL